MSHEVLNEGISFGRTIAIMMYPNTKIPPEANAPTINKILIIVESIPKYSPKPPHTPKSLLSLKERYNLRAAGRAASVDGELASAA